jgi:hypothetical protein
MQRAAYCVVIEFARGQSLTSMTAPVGHRIIAASNLADQNLHAIHPARHHLTFGQRCHRQNRFQGTPWILDEKSQLRWFFFKMQAA